MKEPSLCGETYSRVSRSWVCGQVRPMRDFFGRHPEALLDVILLSLLSTMGQILIYHTVKRHGPVTLTTIMTTRQMLGSLHVG